MPVSHNNIKDNNVCAHIVPICLTLSNHTGSAFILAASAKLVTLIVTYQSGILLGSYTKSL